MRKDRRDLERANHPPPRDSGGSSGCDILTVVNDLPGARLKKFGEKIKDRGFSGAIRTDQRMDRAAADLQIHLLHGHKAAELPRQPAGLEDQVFHAMNLRVRADRLCLSASSP